MAEKLPSDQQAKEARRPIAPAMDPAAKSLADALRVSFRLLAVIMIFVLAAFLLTGFKQIETQEVGIKKVFGRIVGTAEQGLAYTWPFPVGQIDVVRTSQRTLTVEDFWMHETAAEKTRKLSERRGGAALRPGWDGALLTGDHNLLHVKLECKYSVLGTKGAVACARNFALGRNVRGGDRDLSANGDSLEEAISAVVCQAVIAAAAKRTADGIQRRQMSQFAAEVKRQAQRRINQLTPVAGRPYQAVEISAIVVKNSTWPIGALRAYEEAQQAISDRERIRDEAIADARRILNEAAGASVEILVGSPEELTGAKTSGSAEREKNGPYDLIGQYAMEKDPIKAQRLLGRIEEVLMSSTTGGQASRIIADARAYKTQTIQSAEGRTKRFNDLLKEYQKAPQFMLERLWADTRDEILSFPLVEKIYLSMGKQKMVYMINRPPEIAKAIQRELLKLEREKRGQATRRR